MKNKILLLIMTACMCLFAVACAGGQTPFGAEDQKSGAVINEDREGNPIKLPREINKVISMGPSNTEILVALGFADKIIAIDEYSGNIAGLNSNIPMFDMMTPDGELIISLAPDILFVTGMSRFGGDEPFKAVMDADICVIYIPSSFSIGDIKEDIRYIAAVMGAEQAGGEIIAQMEQEIAAVREIGETITDKKTVYFEVEAPPYMVSFGAGVFLHEMIELIGAENILGDQESWLSLADEMLVIANPDVILTSVNYIEDPVGEIMTRPGWGGITAVINGDVHRIDTDASNRPSHNIVKALHEMAKAVYPEKY